jgi:hypothetical protein
MTKTLQTPDFKSEAEEAAWWDSHPDETLALFEQAAKDGALGRGTLARRYRTGEDHRAKARPPLPDVLEDDHSPASLAGIRQ